MSAMKTDADLIARFDGLYVGMLDGDEVEAFADLCRRGLMKRSYEHSGGLFGLAKAKALSPAVAEAGE